MAKRYVLACLAAVAVAVGANAKELQQLNNGIRVTPIKVAPAKMVDGQVVFGEWQNYSEPVATASIPIPPVSRRMRMVAVWAAVAGSSVRPTATARPRMT
ncbi:MAG: hypothetical protein EDS66_16730 [Planctomycetota bacterium]|nr:MAG: hypothetical protein EDS66_16730 [Planctomycetota bacterium]